MEFGSTAALLIAGAVLLAIGFLIRRRLSRYDVRGMITSSLWQVARRKRTAERRTDIEQRLSEITSAATPFGKARRATGHLIGHLVAPVLSLVSLGLILGGVALMAAAFFLR
jgi:hypothetical protein